jgi:hypothetical protein
MPQRKPLGVSLSNPPGRAIRLCGKGDGQKNGRLGSAGATRSRNDRTPEPHSSATVAISPKLCRKFRACQDSVTGLMASRPRAERLSRLQQVVTLRLPWEAHESKALRSRTPSVQIRAVGEKGRIGVGKSNPVARTANNGEQAPRAVWQINARRRSLVHPRAGIDFLSQGPTVRRLASAKEESRKAELMPIWFAYPKGNFLRGIYEDRFEWSRGRH